MELKRYLWRNKIDKFLFCRSVACPFSVSLQCNFATAYNPYQKLRYNSEKARFGVLLQLYSPSASYIGCASYICFTSDMPAGVSGEYNITETAGFNIAFCASKIYHSVVDGISPKIYPSIGLRENQWRGFLSKGQKVFVSTFRSLQADRLFRRRSCIGRGFCRSLPPRRAGPFRSDSLGYWRRSRSGCAPK